MSILYTNFGVAAAVLLMLLLRRVLKNKFSAAIFIVLWLAVLLRVLVPVEIETPIGVFSAERTPKSYPAYELEHDAKQENAPAVSDNAQNALPNKNDARVEVKPQKYNSEQVIFCLRICGTAVFGLYFALCHLRTLRRCKNFEHSKDVAKSKLLASLGCKRKIVLLESADVESPFSFGIIKPKIVLPAGCTKEQLLPVMAHEYVHIRDNDAVFKLIGLAAVCAAWFNPFVWIAFKYFDRDLERFCDERVLRLLGFEHALKYARTLLDFAERQNRWAAMQSFTADPLEERIMGILNMKKRKTSKLLSVFTVAAVLVTMTACSTTALAAETLPDGENTSVIKIEIPESGENAGNNSTPEETSSPTDTDDDFGTIKVDESEAGGASADRKAYRTFDRKWDFYDIFSSDYARPTKYASSVLWTSEGFVYIDGTKGEDVFSTKSGTVKNVGLTSSGYGNIIIIEHDDGTAAVYCHLKEILVDTGDRVEQGDVIATVGTSGNAATPILGFEIIENGVTPLHPEKTVQSVDYFVSIIREK